MQSWGPGSPGLDHEGCEDAEGSEDYDASGYSDCQRANRGCAAVCLAYSILIYTSAFKRIFGPLGNIFCRRGIEEERGTRGENKFEGRHSKIVGKFEI